MKRELDEARGLYFGDVRAFKAEKTAGAKAQGQSIEMNKIMVKSKKMRKYGNS